MTTNRTVTPRQAIAAADFLGDDEVDLSGATMPELIALVELARALGAEL